MRVSQLTSGQGSRLSTKSLNSSKICATVYSFFGRGINFPSLVIASHSATSLFFSKVGRGIFTFKKKKKWISHQPVRYKRVVLGTRTYHDIIVFVDFRLPPLFLLTTSLVCPCWFRDLHRLVELLQGSVLHPLVILLIPTLDKKRAPGVSQTRKKKRAPEKSKPALTM